MNMIMIKQTCTLSAQLVLIIAWKFRAETQCEFSKDEFVNGFSELGVDSLDKLNGKLQILENELNDPLKFKDFYQFTFNYAKEQQQKGLDLDMAIAYWNIVMQGRFKFLDLWCRFLTVSKRNYSKKTYDHKVLDSSVMCGLSC